jgi:hypothetical protein
MNLSKPSHWGNRLSRCLGVRSHFAPNGSHTLWNFHCLKIVRVIDTWGLGLKASYPETRVSANRINLEPCAKKRSLLSAAATRMHEDSSRMAHRKISFWPFGYVLIYHHSNPERSLCAR